MRIFSFNLILAMDFLNKLAEFMTTGLAMEDEPVDTEDVKVSKSVQLQEKSLETIGVRKYLYMTLVGLLVCHRDF